MKLIYFITFSVLLFSCNYENEDSSDLNKAELDPMTLADKRQLVFDKLVGTWQSEDGKSFERWVKDTDDTFHSDAYSVKGNDTIWNEHAKVYMETDRWVYENTVPDQNAGKSVRFISSTVSENQVQFSNPEHDFPNDINYRVIDENTLHAFIVGKNDKGGLDTIPFNYKRVKQ